MNSDTYSVFSTSSSTRTTKREALEEEKMRIAEKVREEKKRNRELREKKKNEFLINSARKRERIERKHQQIIEEKQRLEEMNNNRKLREISDMKENLEAHAEWKRNLDEAMALERQKQKESSQEAARVARKFNEKMKILEKEKIIDEYQRRKIEADDIARSQRLRELEKRKSLVSRLHFEKRWRQKQEENRMKNVKVEKRIQECVEIQVENVQRDLKSLKMRERMGLASNTKNVDVLLIEQKKDINNISYEQIEFKENFKGYLQQGEVDAVRIEEANTEIARLDALLSTLKTMPKTSNSPIQEVHRDRRVEDYIQIIEKKEDFEHNSPGKPISRRKEISKSKRRMPIFDDLPELLLEDTPDITISRNLNRKPLLSKVETEGVPTSKGSRESIGATSFSWNELQGVLPQAPSTKADDQADSGCQSPCTEEEEVSHVIHFGRKRSCLCSCILS